MFDGVLTVAVVIFVEIVDEADNVVVLLAVLEIVDTGVGLMPLTQSILSGN